MSRKWLIDSFLVLIGMYGAYYFNIFGSFIRVALYFCICMAVYFYVKFIWVLMIRRGHK